MKVTSVQLILVPIAKSNLRLHGIADQSYIYSTPKVTYTLPCITSFRRNWYCLSNRYRNCLQL